MSLMVTSDGGYGVLVGKWLPLGSNPGGTPGICPSELLRNREGIRADGWTDDRRQDGHSSVSPEDHDTCSNPTVCSTPNPAILFHMKFRLRQIGLT